MFVFAPCRVYLLYAGELDAALDWKLVLNEEFCLCFFEPTIAYFDIFWKIYLPH